MRINLNKLASLSTMSSLVVGLMTVGTLATPTDASAQTMRYNGTACPAGWVRGSYQDRIRNDTNLCYDRRSDAERSNVNVAKPSRLDRCPLAYFTSEVDPMMCVSRTPNPPTIRIKGNAPCRAGEVEDWGIWCVSNYANLSRAESTTAVRDWNAIYSLNGGTAPRQQDLPEGSEFTPAYLTIFGRVNTDGSPMGSNRAATSGPAAAPPAPAAPAAPTGPRVGSLNPQRQTAASPWCPSGWMDGTNPNTGAREPGMCFPMPQISQPAYPRASENETCIAGYVLNGTWCGRDPNAPLAATAPATQAATPANCPPAGNSNAQQAGAALGGLLGGRRGNSQAGAAIGGLLGQAAGSQARPAGC